MKTKLTKEEKDILDSFEKDEWVPVTNLTIRKKELGDLFMLSIVIEENRVK